MSGVGRRELDGPWKQLSALPVLNKAFRLFLLDTLTYILLEIAVD